MALTARSYRVLVTGAAGFVGRWFMNDLAVKLPEGSTITGGWQRASLDRPDQAGRILLDVCDAAAVDEAIARVRPTCVVHLAAVTTLDEARRDIRRAWDINLFGTMNLALALRRHVPDARLIFVSTSEVYGASFKDWPGPVTEETPINPTNVYGATKAATEQMLGQMTYDGLNVVRLRPFNHTGPGQTQRFVVPSFAAQIVAIERGMQPPVIKVGNLDAYRDFLDVRDVVAAYSLAVLADALPERAILNLASGRPQRIGAILAALLSMARVPITVETDEARLRPNDIPMAAGDATLAKTILNWQPNIAWETTLHDVLESCRAASA